MEMSRKSRSTALLSTGSYLDVHSRYPLPQTSICRCAVCDLEVWLLGEIAVIRPDTAIKRSLCPMSGDRIPLMCPEFHQALQCKTSDKLQFNT
jgi:hypothetical protein